MDTNKEQTIDKAARKTKFLKILLSLVITGLVIFCLAYFGLGLGKGVQNSNPQSDTSEVQVITDSEGRDVEIPLNPQSVAIMDAFSGELAVMLGEGEHVCGVPGGVKSDTMLQKIYPDLSTIASVSGNSVNIESLLDFSCDVALVKATMPLEERNKLEKVGIPYVVIDYVTMDEQVKAIELVGNVFGERASQKATDLVKFYQDTVKLVGDKSQSLNDKEKVKVYHAINDTLLTDSSESLGNDWITKTGCLNVAAQEKATNGSDYSTSVEQVYAWDPDVVICNSAKATQEFMTSDKWSGLRAVKDGKVYTIPTGATRWGQRGSVETYLAMVWLGSVVYPDDYANLDLKSYVVDYYQNYLGLEIDDDLYASIISGRDVRLDGQGSSSQQSNEESSSESDSNKAKDGNGDGTGGGHGDGTGGGHGDGTGGGNGSAQS